MLDYAMSKKRLFGFRISYNILDVRNTQRKRRRFSYIAIIKKLYGSLQIQSSMQGLKHIDVQYHYIRELVKNDTVKLEYIQTSEMAVDCLTKPLKRV
jgi:hypothetical protein